MLDKIFGTNNTLALYLVPLIAIGIGLLGYFTDLNESSSFTEIKLLTEYIGLQRSNTIIQLLVICMINSISAYIITSISDLQEIHEHTNHWPAFFYLIFISIHPDLLLWNGFVPANLFLLMAIYRLFNMYNKPIVFSNVFDAGLLIGIAGFFQPGFWLFELIAVIAILIIRPFNWREIVISFIGFSTPFYAYLFFLFWNNQTFSINHLIDFNVTLSFFSSAQSYSLFGLFTFLLIVSIGLLYASIRYSTIQQRKHKQVLFALTVICIFLSLFYSNKSFYCYSWSVVSLACLIPFIILWIKRNWLKNIAIGIVFLMLIANYIYF